MDLGQAQSTIQCPVRPQVCGPPKSKGTQHSFDLQKDKKIVAKTENFRYNNFVAPIAQLVEHFTRNEGVVSSSLIRSFFHLRMSESEGL